MLKFKEKTNCFYFGISLTSADFTLPFFNNFDFTAFNACEVSFDDVDGFKKTLNNSSAPKEILISNIVSTSIIRGIIEQPKEIKRSFCSELAAKINSLPEKFQKVIIDFDLEESYRNSSYADELVEFLKMLFQSVSRHKRILLPLRIPGDSDGIYHYASEFLNRLPFPLGICLDINPHELGSDFSFFGNLRWIKYDIKTVRIKYEPLLGNKLTLNNLSAATSFLKEFWYDKAVIISPLNSSCEIFEAEISNIIATTDSFMQNSR